MKSFNGTLIYIWLYIDVFRHVKEGQEVKQFDKIAEVQSDKATVEITSRYDGIIKRLHYDIGSTAKVGDPLVDIEVEGQEGSEEEASIQVAEEHRDNEVHPNIQHREEGRSSDVKALPSVRRRAKELGVDLRTIQRPSGSRGQITMEDLKPTTNQVNSYRVTPLNVFQKAMVKSMTESIKIPHFGYHDEIQLDRLLEVRAELNSAQPKAKLTPLHFIIKALSEALKEFPQLNGHFVNDGKELRLWESHNISLAIDTGHGLAVPVIKGVERLSVQEIGHELHRLTDMARQNRLTKADLEGGTITISNIGTIGGTTASPVIPHPQLAIVALGRAQKLPRFNAADQVVPVTLLPVSWAADHRVVDGATIARFSQRWKEIIQSPSLLLIQ